LLGLGAQLEVGAQPINEQLPDRMLRDKRALVETLILSLDIAIQLQPRF
jgi:hypothetical protein